MKGTDCSGRFLLVSASVFPQGRGWSCEWWMLATAGLCSSSFPPVFPCTWTSRPFVSHHISELIFCRHPLCRAPRGSQLCCLCSAPWGGERQQMGLGQRADASDSKRPGCCGEAASVRKLLFPWEPTNHWRKLKMSPLRNAIKSSKKSRLCRWGAAVCLFGC